MLPHFGIPNGFILCITYFLHNVSCGIKNQLIRIEFILSSFCFISYRIWSNDSNSNNTFSDLFNVGSNLSNNL